LILITFPGGLPVREGVVIGAMGMFDNSLAQQYRLEEAARQPPIRFTFFWPAVERWERRDFVINVEGTA
jgi:hypothetical protein